MTTRADSVVIVGAGLGGLSAALRLAGAGRQVTVVEQRSIPGGRAGQLQLGGYTFDTGPSVLTMPDYIAEALDCVGEKLEDWLTLEPLNPAYRANFADGSVIDVLTDPQAMADEIATKCSPTDAAGYLKFVSFLTELYALERRQFIDRNLDSPLDLLSLDALRLVKMGGLRRLSTKVNQFVTDERLRRVFSFQAMYAGLAPQDALAIYAVIAYMDTVAGVYFPKGGMHALPQALAGAAAKHGVDFRYDTRVEQVQVQAGTARAVITEHGERIAADAIVVNADLPIAYDEMLPGQRRPRRLGKIKYSPSCFVQHAGSTASYPQLAHHNIYFGQAWRKTFSEIIDRGQLMSDPAFLVTVPTMTDPGLAPEGRHSYFTLFPTPNLSADIDWSVIGPRYRDEVVARMEQAGMTGFAESIEVEQIVTPADWRADGMALGAPFAAAHSFAQSGPFRPPTRDRGVANLYFCGSNAQPGVGVPMVLLSGRLAAERITGR